MALGKLFFDQDWLKSQEEAAAFEKALNTRYYSLGNNGIASLGSGVKKYKDLLPTAPSSLHIALAELQVDTPTTYELYKGSKTQLPNYTYRYMNPNQSATLDSITRGLSKAAEDPEDKSNIFADSKLIQNLRNRIGGNGKPDDMSFLDKISPIIGLLTGVMGEVKKQSSISSANYLAELEEIAKSKGMTLEDWISYEGDERTKYNKAPLLDRILAFSRSRDVGEMMKSYNQTGVFTGLTPNAEQWLLKQGKVNEDGTPFIPQTEFDFLTNEKFAEYVAKTLLIRNPDGELRKMDLNEMIATMYQASAYAFRGTPDERSAYNVFGGGALAAGEESRAKGVEYGLAQTPGDSLSLVAGSTFRYEYSPRNPIFEETQAKYQREKEILATKLKDYIITQDEYKEQLDAVIDAEQDEIDELQFQQERGLWGRVSGIANLAAEFALDIPLGLTKPVKGPLLQGVGKQIAEYQASGKSVAEFFVDKQDIVQGVASSIHESVKKGGPVFIELVQRAKIPVSLADDITNAQNAKEVAKILEKSVRGGQIADMQFGKQSLSGSKQFTIQGKALSDNFLSNLMEQSKSTDEAASYARTGNLTEFFERTDIKAPNQGVNIDLDNPDKAVDQFMKVGVLWSIPKRRIEQLSKSFYKNIKEGNHFEAQNVFYDELIGNEGAKSLFKNYKITPEEATEVITDWTDKARRGFNLQQGEYNATIKSKWLEDENYVPLITEKLQGKTIYGLEDAAAQRTSEAAQLGHLASHTISIPNFRGFIRMTGFKRKAIGQTRKEYVDELIVKAEDLQKRGVKGNLFDPESPLGEILADALAETPGNPKLLYQAQAGATGKMEKRAFDVQRKYWSPLTLLFSAKYPAKVTLDTLIRAAIFGFTSAFRGFTNWFKMLFNDPDGQIAKWLGVDVVTDLTGAFRKVQQKEYDSKFLGRLPKVFHKTFNMFDEDLQKFSSSELADATAMNPLTRYKEAQLEFKKLGLINKKGTPDNLPQDVPVKQLSEDYVDNYIGMLRFQINEPLSPTIAAGIVEGYTDEALAELISSDTKLSRVIQFYNKKLVSRDNQMGKTIPLINTNDDLVRLVKDYRITLMNLTNGDTELLKVIASGRVKNVDLTDATSLRTTQDSKIKAYLKPLIDRNVDDLPSRIPNITERAATGKSDQALWGQITDSLWFTVQQIESTLARIPTFKQAKYWYIENLRPFITKEGYEDLLKAHFDSTNEVRLPDNIVQMAKDELALIASKRDENLKLLDKKVDPAFSIDSETNALSGIVFNSDGKLPTSALKNATVEEGVLKLDADISKAEFKAYKEARKVADIRAGADNSAIGTYDINIDADSLIINNEFSESQLKGLRYTLSNVLDDKTNLDNLIEQASDYLKQPGANINGLADRLGLGKNFDEIEVQNILNKAFNRSKYITPAGQVRPKYIKELAGLESLKSKPILYGTVKKDESYGLQNLHQKVLQKLQNADGVSIDLNKPLSALDDATEQVGIYVSPYPEVEEIFDTISAQEIGNFINKNKSKLGRDNHVLGFWTDKDTGEIYLSVSIKMSRGVADDVLEASPKQLAKAHMLAKISDQFGIADVSIEKVGMNAYVDSGTADVAELIRTNAAEFMDDVSKKQMGDIPIVEQNTNFDIEKFQILRSANVYGKADLDNNTLELFDPRSNKFMDDFTEIDYFDVIDINGVRENARNITFGDLDELGNQFAIEIHDRLLYNLSERGYLAEQYRLGFPFFEAYRDVLGTYTKLSYVNPRAAAKVGFGYRQGITSNLIYEDKNETQYLIIPVGGTSLEDYVKSEGNGTWTEDGSDLEGNVIFKRSYPVGALGVAGGGLMPPIGPFVAIPVGFITNVLAGNEVTAPYALRTRRYLEKTLFPYGLPYGTETSDIFDIAGEAAQGFIPATAKQFLNRISSNLNIQGVDSDLYMSATNDALRIASVLHPDKDVDELFKTTDILRDNIFAIKAWDRNVNPFTPKINVLYRADLENDKFKEWIGSQDERTGIVYNSFIELSIIQSFFNDIKDEYVVSLGPKQGEYQAMLDVVILLGLDRYSLEDSFTSASLLNKGKTISEAGRIARTEEEYNFYTDNADLQPDYGPILMYFYDGIGKPGKSDYSGFGFVKGLGLVETLDKYELYYRASTYGKSLVERSLEDYVRTELEETQGKVDQELLRDFYARIDAKLRQMFPLAYSDEAPKELAKLPGRKTTSALNTYEQISLLEEAVEDPRMAKFGNTKVLAEYLGYRQSVVDVVLMTIKKDKTYYSDKQAKNDALNYIRTTDAPEAQFFRDLLYDKIMELSVNNDAFRETAMDTFFREVDAYGLGDDN